ncbi:hypothetical protein SAMN05216360_101535 [Methylobacterium phyllostachyos]|uniref:Uncharacterized protein n=1 Tax=Methylobacterium phyllostachyos TaxID=582672 RepID=A0A1G9S8Q4_9HYPH|nr:hypothetical protein [Methylobacterium phyllostachyos]SDM31720.1 hypothetical protein SAMN05216360_101535 [Methylobacterium phyllostachyos]
MRKLSQFFALVMAAMAAMAQKVWDGTRWVAKAFSGIPTPQGVEVEDAMDAVAAKASAPVTASQPARDGVTPAPAPAPKPEVAPKPAAKTAQVVELDPVLAKGKAAHAFACALATLGDEPPTEGLNEAEIAWLNSLNTYEMMHVWRAGPMQAGAHMLGIKAIPGLPLCPTLSEYRHILGSAAQVTPRQREEIAEYNATLDAAFDEMINSPTFELKHGI